MDFNEILGYFTEGIKWLGIGGASTYFAAMLSNPISIIFSKKIRTQGELDSIIERESKKLGLIDVTGILLDEDEAICYYSVQGPTVKVGGMCANVSNVRHELYHLYRDNWNPFQTGFAETIRFYLIEEPRACLYQSLRLRL